MTVEFFDFDSPSVTQVDHDAPLNTFSDEDIAESLIELAAEVRNINRQLVADQLGHETRSGDWRRRASGAKRYKLQIIDKLRMEASRRGMAEVLPDYAAQEQAQRDFDAQKAAHAARIKAEQETRILPHKMLMEQQREIADRKRAERETMHRITMEAEAGKAQVKSQLFLAAARKVLAKDQVTAIWAAAVELFPDHEAFQDRHPQAKILDEARS